MIIALAVEILAASDECAALAEPAFVFLLITFGLNSSGSSAAFDI